MRALGIHETVMQLMVNTLNKAQHQTAAAQDSTAKRRSSVTSNPQEVEAEGSKVEQPGHVYITYFIISNLGLGFAVCIFTFSYPHFLVITLYASILHSNIDNLF